MSGIFISYRRSTSQHFARSIFTELQQRGHDVFLDVNSIDSGAFDNIIRNQIAARPHFLLILSKGALERCVNEQDWLLKEIQEAIRLNRNVVPVYDDGFNFADEKQFLPEPLQKFLSLQNAPPYSHYYFKAFIDALSERFFKDAVDNVVLTPTPSIEQAEVQKRIEQAAGPEDGWTPKIEATDPIYFSKRNISPETQTELTNFTRRVAQAKQEMEAPQPAQPLIWGVENILPPPFEWVYIPEGVVESATGTKTISSFNIAKYPITNAQYEVFIQAEDGYRNPNWWDAHAYSRAWHETNPLSLQRAFPEDDHPRANVNYYEAQAFCHWLEYRFNAPAPDLPRQYISIPLDDQWQRAAYGDKRPSFPWGEARDTRHFNFNESQIGKTTPVKRYLSGASVFGVMDMVGNVFEWTELIPGFPTKTMNVRGGSWAHDYVTEMRGRLWEEPPDAQKDTIGFRIVMMNTPPT